MHSRRIASPRRAVEFALTAALVVFVLFSTLSALHFRITPTSSQLPKLVSEKVIVAASEHDLDRDAAPEPNTNREMPGMNRKTDPVAFFGKRFLPRPQLRLNPDRPMKYQMHNCLKGRDGSKFGLRDAGIPWSPAQKSTMQLIKVFDEASFVLACSNVRPSKAVSRDPKVNGKKLVATSVGIVEDYCLGSFKTLQLECRRDLATRFGCDFNDLGIQPAQYILANVNECYQVLDIAAKHNKPWLIKPSHSLRGRGIRYFQDSASLIEEITMNGGCDKKTPLISLNLVQEYVQNPALLDIKYKFDVRTWLLVASVDPLILFYHDGFVRVARNAYEEASNDIFAHITNLKGSEAKSTQEGGGRTRSYLRSFAETSEELTKQFGLPKNFMQNQFRKRIARAQVFAALSQFMRPLSKDIPPRKAFYHTFACDSVVDRLGGVHLLECNGFPAEAQQATLDKHWIADPQTQWKQKMALVLNLHLEPWRLMVDQTLPTKQENDDQSPLEYTRRGFWKHPPLITNGETFSAGKYAFGGWHLIFNELETPFTELNACVDFTNTVKGVDDEQDVEQQELDLTLADSNMIEQEVEEPILEEDVKDA
ncbi:hypothetical protein BASA81_010132 [Batrachochytrium salamandrivorans]|nr:hypothetical protein BASA81_010132 [Batrachochytrium salamandrivorans]